MIGTVKSNINILVVGGVGYIGGVVTDVLIKKGASFTVYDNLLYEHQYLKPVDFIYGDVRDTKKLKKLLPNYSHVIWLAAIVGDKAGEINPVLTIAVNQETVKWLVNNYNGRIIFTSTCSVYGQHDALLDENSSVNPLSLYAKTKLQAEKYLEKGNHLIFRLGTAFGVSDTYSRLRMDLVVNYMTTNALTKGKLSIFGGNQWRPLIHVKDIGATIVNNLEKQIKGTYNLATVNLQIKDIGKIISETTGCAIEYTEEKFEDKRNYHVNYEGAVKDKIFNPATMRSVQDGVREITDLVKSGRIKYTENDTYFNVRHITNLNKNGQFI